LMTLEGHEMKITVDSRLRLRDIPSDFECIIRQRLTFSNPKFEEAERMGRWTGDIDPYLYYWEKTTDGAGLILPRGFTRQLIFMARKHGVTYQVEDRRRTLPPVPFEFHGKLRDFQEDALSAILARDFGIEQAPTGSGKTVIALAAIAARRQPALVVVHTKELLNQWMDRIQAFLQIPRQEIGQIGAGKQIIGSRITVGMVQTIYKSAQHVAPKIGFLVVDECHRAPSRTFSEAVIAFDCRYMLGLSATPWRRDKLTRLIYWYLGDRVHEVDRTALQEAGHILKAEVVWRKTDFLSSFDPTEEYSRMLSELTQDPARNQLIASDVARAAQNGGGTCLCLSDRKAHCETLSGLLRGYGIGAPVLTGDTGKREREEIVERLNAGGIKVLCATYQLLSEGFDSKELSTLFLGSPVRFDGKVIQVLGRILRPAPGKKATVYDYVDTNIGVLRAAARARAKVYGATS
jgi:superfamily II DNA or RNA helicase